MFPGTKMHKQTGNHHIQITTIIIDSQHLKKMAKEMIKAVTHQCQHLLCLMQLLAER